MKTTNIYNTSYTDGQNQIVHDYIENATEKELVDLIKELQKLYEPQIPYINTTIQQVEKEVIERDILNQKYNELLNCKKEWKKYFTNLINYKDELIIHQKYVEYEKNEYPKLKKELEKCNKLDRFIEVHSNDSDFPGKCEYEIMIAALSDGSKCRKSKPMMPKSYYSAINEIPVRPLNRNESMEKLGKDNLKYLLHLMIFSIDLPQAKNTPVIISFLTRKYAATNHKASKQLPLFTTNMLSTPELLVKIEELISELNIIKNECTELVDEVEKIKKQ